MREDENMSSSTIIRHTDKYNSQKVWLIKRYADGHYGLNQEIAGRVFYAKYQRVTKAWIDEVFGHGNTMLAAKE